MIIGLQGNKCMVSLRRMTVVNDMPEQYEHVYRAGVHHLSFIFI